MFAALCTTCGGDGEVPPDAAPPNDSGTTGGVVPVDGVDPPPDIPSGKETYELGTNIQGKTSPLAFTVLTTGATAPIVKGSQGAWMLVVSARTDLLAPGTKRVDIEAELGPPGGEPYGKLKFKRRPVLDGGDGFRYLMNVFLVVSNNEEWNGQEADLRVVMEEEATGIKLEETVRIVLEKTTEDGG